MVAGAGSTTSMAPVMASRRAQDPIASDSVSSRICWFVGLVQDRLQKWSDRGRLELGKGFVEQQGEVLLARSYRSHRSEALLHGMGGGAQLCSGGFGVLGCQVAPGRACGDDRAAVFQGPFHRHGSGQHHPARLGVTLTLGRFEKAPSVRVRPEQPVDSLEVEPQVRMRTCGFERFGLGLAGRLGASPVDHRYDDGRGGDRGQCDDAEQPDVL